MALSDAERQRLYRERRKSGAKLIHYRQPTDRRTSPQRWADAVATLIDILDSYQEWRENMPGGVADSATAQKLDDVLTHRDVIEELQNADLPKGFGRD